MKKRFILLKDLAIDTKDKYTLNFDMKKEFSENIDHIMREHTINFSSININTINSKVSKILDKKYFIITLDAGSYISEYDISFEISRTCVSINDLRSNKVFRMPRENYPLLRQQCIEIKEIYNTKGNNKPIAIFDDRIGTGESLRSIINTLDDLGLTVTNIYVLLNPKKLNKIEYADVHTIFKYDEDYDWLSERDLIWGITRSGLTYRNNKSMVSSIPYTLDIKLIQQKIGNFINIESFRKKILDLNIYYYKQLEEIYNKQIYFSDIKRLSFFLEYLDKDMRVIDFLKEINKENYEFTS